MVEATVQDRELEKADMLRAMREMITLDPEPGDMRPGDEVPTEGLDAAMMVAKTKSAGTSYIWDNRTGERSKTNNNMLPTQLSKRREDGSYVFTQRDPGIIPKRGALKCMLHPDNRAEHPQYDTWGFVSCNKCNLASPQDVKSHMMMRHKREWATIEDDRTEREKAEDRAIMRANNEATLAALKVATENRAGPAPEITIGPASEAGQGEIKEKKGPFGRPLKTT